MEKARSMLARMAREIRSGERDTFDALADVTAELAARGLSLSLVKGTAASVARKAHRSRWQNCRRALESLRPVGVL